MPNPADQETWTCDYGTTLAKGLWALNIVPWWGIGLNMHSEDDYFGAYVSPFPPYLPHRQLLELC